MQVKCTFLMATTLPKPPGTIHPEACKPVNGAFGSGADLQTRTDGWENGCPEGSLLGEWGHPGHLTTGCLGARSL